MSNADTDQEQPSPVERTTGQRVLFIGGLGRSGSTLVERLLNELPGTFSVGETVHLWERGVRDGERCGCGDAFAACPHWTAVGKEAFGSWDDLDVDRIIDLRWKVDRSRRLPAIMAALRTGRTTTGQREYLAAMRSVLLASAKVAGRSLDRDPSEICLLDSSKHLSTAALLATDPWLDLRVLHLVRDPRGVAYSWTKTVARPETDGELMPRYSVRRTAGRWVSDNLGFDALAGAGVPTLRVRYEDVLDDPARMVCRIAEFAGLDGDPRHDRLPFLAGRSAHFTTPMHSVAGNPLRFGGDRITLEIDDAWRTELPEKSRRTIERVTGPVLARYGYGRSLD